MLPAQQTGSTILSSTILTQYNFPADGAASHTGQPVFTIRAALAEVVPEILENRTVPCLLNGMGPQVHRPPSSLVVKTTRQHHHIRADVGRPAGALASINAVQIDFD